MKLYEFTFTDKFGLSKSEVLEYLRDFLLEKSSEESWNPNYIIKFNNGYFDGKVLRMDCEVHGEYLETSPLEKSKL